MVQQHTVKKGGPTCVSTKGKLVQKKEGPTYHPATTQCDEQLREMPARIARAHGQGAGHPKCPTFPCVGGNSKCTAGAAIFPPAIGRRWFCRNRCHLESGVTLSVNRSINRAKEQKTKQKQNKNKENDSPTNNTGSDISTAADTNVNTRDKALVNDTRPIPEATDFFRLGTAVVVVGVVVVGGGSAGVFSWGSSCCSRSWRYWWSRCLFAL